MPAFSRSVGGRRFAQVSCAAAGAVVLVATSVGIVRQTTEQRRFPQRNTAQIIRVLEPRSYGSPSGGSPPPPPPTGYELTIDGFVRAMQPRWEIREAANTRATFRFKVLSADGAYRPSLDEEVILTEDGEIVFAGYITDLEEAGLGNEGVVPILTTVTAEDYNVLAKRRHVTAALPSGSLKAALTVVVTYLTGVSLDPSQVDGPTLPSLDWADVGAEEALNHLQTLTDYNWAITSDRLLRMTAPGTVPAPFDISVPNCKAIGDVKVQPTRDNYANRVVVRSNTGRAQADDAAEQASHGIWELVASAPDSTPDDGLQALADALLARSTPILKRARYSTYTKGVKAGQTQTINLSRRNVNNEFLITDVRTFDVGPLLIRRDVVAIEGLVYQTGWREAYRQWSSGGLAIAGAGGSPTFLRFAYFLGGNGIDATRSSVPTWVPAAGGGVIGQASIQVQINTIPRGTTSALITARLRALDAGVSVQARLYDVTASAPCAGVSAVVTSTSWQTVAFDVVLASGSHLYELQLLPGTANADVLGTAYLE